MRQDRKAASFLVGFAVMVLFILFVLFNALIIIQGLLGSFSSVQSDSMSPDIEMHDGVIKSPLDPRDLQVGQVIVFPDPQDSSRSLVRRIVEVQQENGLTCFITKGDRNPGNDPYPVPAGNVEGIVSTSVPWLGPVIDFAGSTYGFLVTVLLPSCIIVFYLVTRYRQKRRPASKERCGLSSVKPVHTH